MRKSIYYYICFLIIAGQGLAHPAPSKHEIRGLWVVRHSITSPGKIDRLLEFARDCKITDMFVQVRGRADAYYNSSYEAKAHDIPDPDFDPLGYLLQKTASDSIRIHAWLNVFYVWSKDSLPGDRNHIVRRRADWLARPLNQPQMTLDYPASTRRAQTEGLYISPLQPEAQEYFLKIVQDILEKYKIAGIHLDYIRYPNQRFDLHPDVVQGFRRRYVLNPQQFLDDPDRFAQKFSVAGYETFYYHWQKFLMDGLSDYVKRISREVRSMSPGVMISAAVKPDIYLAHWDFYQDWDRWVREGWLDFAVPMNYTPDKALFRKRLDEYLENLPQDKYLVGVALYNQNPKQSIPKIAQVQALENSGFVLFSYNQLQEQLQVQNYLRNGGIGTMDRKPVKNSAGVRVKSDF